MAEDATGAQINAGATDGESFVAKPLITDASLSNNQLRDDLPILEDAMPPKEDSLEVLANDKKTVQQLKDLFATQVSLPKQEPLKPVLGYGENEIKPLNDQGVKDAIREWFMDNQPKLDVADRNERIDWKSVSERLTTEIEARQKVGRLLLREPRIKDIVFEPLNNKENMWEKWLGPLGWMEPRESRTPLEPRGIMTGTSGNLPEMPRQDLRELFNPPVEADTPKPLGENRPLTASDSQTFGDRLDGVQLEDPTINTNTSQPKTDIE